MTKLLIGLLGAGVLATAGYAASTGMDDTTPARTVSLTAATTTTTGTATDDTTTAGTTTDTTPDDIVVGGTVTGDAGTGVDVSGPCDEAEHSGDARCKGGAGAADDHEDVDHEDDDGHHSGRGGDDDGDDHSGHGDYDRSGSNSGTG